MSQSFLQNTKGRVRLDIFPAALLGQDDSLMRGLTIGNLDIVLIHADSDPIKYKPLKITAAPYAFRTYDDWQLFQGSKFFSGMKDDFYDATGNVLAGAIYGGQQQLQTTKPIDQPSDLRDTTIKVGASGFASLFPKAMGATPTVMTDEEANQALDHGRLDGVVYNPLFESSILTDKAKYLNLTEHAVDSVFVLISGKRWSLLDEDTKHAIDRAVTSTNPDCDKLVRDYEERQLAAFSPKANVRSVDREPFAKMVASYLPGSDYKWLPQLYNEITHE
jgi:TRAP-type C4-dicarboxylate transport system substrate-binding protein